MQLKLERVFRKTLYFIVEASGSDWWFVGLLFYAAVSSYVVMLCRIRYDTMIVN
jgi:hypothetical protein